MTEREKELELAKSYFTPAAVIIRSAISKAIVLSLVSWAFGLAK
jgi:hypothetical protein